MSIYKKTIASFSIAVAVCAIIAGVSFIPKWQADNLPGEVVGPNPSNIKEDKLPVCVFTGADFVELPCYRPPEINYL